MPFRPKPVLIDAVRWRNGQLGGSAPDWVLEALNGVIPGEVGSLFRLGNQVQVVSPSGTDLASDGEWIVRDIHGQLSVWNDQAFRHYFEPADTAPTGAVVSIDWDAYNKAHGR